MKKITIFLMGIFAIWLLALPFLALGQSPETPEQAIDFVKILIGLGQEGHWVAVSAGVVVLAIFIVRKFAWAFIKKEVNHNYIPYISDGLVMVLGIAVALFALPAGTSVWAYIGAAVSASAASWLGTGLHQRITGIKKIVTAKKSKL